MGFKEFAEKAAKTSLDMSIKAGKAGFQAVKDHRARAQGYDVEVETDGFNIAGATFHQSALRKFAKWWGVTRDGSHVSVQVALQPDKGNKADKDAIAVISPKTSELLGYVPRDVTPKIWAIAPKTGRGKTWQIVAPAEMFWWDNKQIYLIRIYA